MRCMNFGSREVPYIVAPQGRPGCSTMNANFRNSDVSPDWFWKVDGGKAVGPAIRKVRNG